MISDFLTNERVVQEARKKLNQGAWDYLVGASESETTMRRNRLAFDRIAFRPRILEDVSEIDPSTTFLGQNLRIPVMLAPLGSAQVFTPGGGAEATRAAAEFGTMHVLSSVSEPTLEEVAAAADHPKYFQLYIRGDDDWTDEMIGRIKAADYKAFCITVDTAHYSRRERPLLSGYTPPTQSDQANPVRRFGSGVTWAKVDRMKSMIDMPFMLKGIATAEDAKIAIEHGIDVIWVSNHGGRQLDHGQGTMEMLPEIVEAVDGKAKIVLDGGIARGSDVLKAIAMGADAVAIGRLQAWGLGAAGKDGVVKVLENLEDEIIIAMALMGVTSIDKLNSNYVCAAEAVTMPHEMSAWINLPGERIQ